MANDFRDWPRWILLNGRRGLDLSHVTDFDLRSSAVNPATGMVEPCVTVTFDSPEDRSTDKDLFIWRVRAIDYFGDDAAALRAWIPTVFKPVNKP